MGNAVVSDIHANFIVNEGATAGDVIVLMQEFENEYRKRSKSILNRGSGYSEKWKDHLS